MINKLKSFRKAKGYTQEEIAKILGISREHFCRIENGKNIPSIKLALYLKDILSCYCVDELFFLNYTEQSELDERKYKVLSDHEDWSPDVPLDEYDS